MEMKRVPLRDAIKKSKYKQSYLASELGIHPSTFSRIIASPGRLSKDKLKLEKILKLLEMDAQEIDFS